MFQVYFKCSLHFFLYIYIITLHYYLIYFPPVELQWHLEPNQPQMLLPYNVPQYSICMF